VEELGGQLIEMSGSAAEPVFALGGYAGKGMAALHRADFMLARHHLEAAIAFADQLDDPLLDVFIFDPAVLCRGYLALTYWALDAHEMAREVSIASFEVAARSGHGFSVSTARLLASWYGVLRRDPVAVRTYSGEILAEERAFDPRVMAGLTNGWADALLGSNTDPRAMVERLSDLQSIGWSLWRPFMLGMLAEAQALSGGPADALATLERAQRAATASGEHFYEPELWRLRGELTIASGPEGVRQGRELLGRAVAVARDQGAHPLRRRAEQSLAAAPPGAVLT
jgi:hypothetical protein